MDQNALPAGFTLVRRGNTVLALREDYCEQLLRQGIHEPQRLIQSSPHVEYLQGRTSLAVMPIEGAEDERMVIRHYRRGGLLGKVVKDLFFGRSRPFRELRLCEEARARGVETIEVLAAEHHGVLGRLHRADLVSKEWSGSIDLLGYLGRSGTPPSPSQMLERRKVIAAVGAAVRRMHDANILHRDLHLKNILIRQDRERDIEVRIIDLDKSCLCKAIGSRRRIANLSRLNRSVTKFGVDDCVSRTDRMRFLRAYVKTGDDWRGMRQKLFATCRRDLRLHSLLWRRRRRPAVEPTDFVEVELVKL